LFCTRCGQQIPDATEICPLCGREASLRLDPPPPAPVTAPQFHLPAPLAPIVHGPNGVKGWLLVYCLTLTMLGPAFVVINFSAEPSRFTNPSGLMETIRIAYGMVVGILLWTRRPISLLLLKVYFIIIAAQFALFSLDMVALSLRQHSSVFLAPTFPALAIGAGITLLWFAYFRKSVRVRNTFGANL